MNTIGENDTSSPADGASGSGGYETDIVLWFQPRSSFPPHLFYQTGDLLDIELVP